MNPFEFVLAIVIVTFAFQIIRHRLGMTRSSRGELPDEPQRNYENERLKGQVQQLQERIRVLERIVTDRGVETAAQIEALRDRSHIKEGDQA